VILVSHPGSNRTYSLSSQSIVASVTSQMSETIWPVSRHGASTRDKGDRTTVRGARCMLNDVGLPDVDRLLTVPQPYAASFGHAAA
jgi:hypothetical protein